PEFPFLGVHFTRMIDDSVHAGPNAVLAFKREGYSRTDINCADLFETLTFSGFWNLARRYYRDGIMEMLRSVSKRAFVKSLQQLIPEITEDDLVPTHSGVRAQALMPDGKLVDDFLIVKGKNSIHVCNAPSPAATASLEIGLCYVGLPMAMQFARANVTVLGLDIDAAKVDSINQGRSYIKHIGSEAIEEVVKQCKLSASTDFNRVREVEAVIICVPTPLSKNREPDISFILETGRTIAPHLSNGALVVLESTTYPGTTDEDLRAVLEQGSNMQAGVDFHLAFSPEREDPANEQSKVKLIPKVVGGYTPACLQRAMMLYGKTIDKVVPVSSCRVAEASKLLENIFRSVNIALVNELKIVYGAMGIDIWEVIEAAKTKPFGFMPFYPGPGLGGHCIPIDPFYLT